MSPATPFTINDTHVNPVVIIKQNAPNIACNGANTGELSASVTEGTTTGVTANYTFEWFTGTTASGVPFATGPVISGQADGDYTVRVTDTSTPGLGCSTTATMHLEKVTPSFVVALASTPQTVCSPADGSVAVTTITETLGSATTTYTMSNPADLAKFTFVWTDGATGNPIAVPATASSVSALPAGTYIC